MSLIKIKNWNPLFKENSSLVAYGLHLSNFIDDFQALKTMMNTSLRF